MPTSLDLSLNMGALELDYRAVDDALSLITLAFGGAHAISSAAPFAVYVDDARVTDFALAGLNEGEWQNGARTVDIEVRSASTGLHATHHTRVFAGAPLVEMWQTVRNGGTSPVRVTRIDSMALNLVAGDYELLRFTSDWGSEFEPVRGKLEQDTLVETRSGRSSKGMSPWFGLFRADGLVLSGAVAWSGNWVFRFEQAEAGNWAITGGLHDWESAKVLAPGASMDSPPVALALGSGGDLNTTSRWFGRVGRSHWYPRNGVSDGLPVEWNHWWSYEDKLISEDVFVQNAEASAKLGMDICTLDAGWFGPSDPETHWYDMRGDWDLVNATRFPNGIRAVADAVHARGMKFGLWCEIEALGVKARLAETHPEFVATRDGERMGYVCMGNPAVQQWAFDTLSHLIDDYAADWIKLDFNLDPGAGCNRTDHGHGAGDGLYEHYVGYYAVLDRIRARYPNVILENCSSGGLRIDLGLARHTHMAFLSDPDWPVHDLQLFWGVSTFLAPNAALHWGYCEWINGHPPQQFSPRSPDLTQGQFDYYTRISMLNLFGFSQKMPDLPDWVAARVTHHVEVYKTVVRRFLREADVIRLTTQPRRDGSGDRWAAFQYALPDGAEHLLFVFRMPGGEPQRAFGLRELEPQRVYTVEWVGEGRRETHTGAALMSAGLTFGDLAEEGSALLRIS